MWCWRRLLRVPWTARQCNQSILKEISPGVHWKDLCWSWNSNSLATWCEEMTHLKRLWFWERLAAGGEGDNGGWDSWMASLTQWTWVWVSSGSWWWTGKPGMLQSMGWQSQTRLSDWTEVIYHLCEKYYKSITVQYYIANRVSWVPRQSLLDFPNKLDLMNALSEWNSFICNYCNYFQELLRTVTEAQEQAHSNNLYETLFSGDTTDIAASLKTPLWCLCDIQVSPALVAPWTVECRRCRVACGWLGWTASSLSPLGYPLLRGPRAVPDGKWRLRQL